MIPNLLFDLIVALLVAKKTIEWWREIQPEELRPEPEPPPAPKPAAPPPAPKRPLIRHPTNPIADLVHEVFEYVLGFHGVSRIDVEYHAFTEAYWVLVVVAGQRITFKLDAPSAHAYRPGIALAEQIEARAREIQERLLTVEPMVLGPTDRMGFVP